MWSRPLGQADCLWHAEPPAPVPGAASLGESSTSPPAAEEVAYVVRVEVVASAHNRVAGRALCRSLFVAAVWYTDVAAAVHKDACTFERGPTVGTPLGSVGAWQPDWEPPPARAGS